MPGAMTSVLYAHGRLIITGKVVDQLIGVPEGERESQWKTCVPVPEI